MEFGPGGPNLNIIAFVFAGLTFLLMVTTFITKHIMKRRRAGLPPAPPQNLKKIRRLADKPVLVDVYAHTLQRGPEGGWRWGDLMVSALSAKP